MAAIETTAIQRAFGFTYETEKAFQTAVKMNVVETMPPSENLLKFTARAPRRRPCEALRDPRLGASVAVAESRERRFAISTSAAELGRLGATRNGYLSGKRCTAPMEN